MKPENKWRSPGQFVSYMIGGTCVALPIYAWVLRVAHLRWFVILVVLGQSAYAVAFSTVMTYRLLFPKVPSRPAAHGLALGWRGIGSRVMVLLGVGTPCLMLFWSGYREASGVYALISMVGLYLWTNRLRREEAPAHTRILTTGDQLLKASALYVIGDLPLAFAVAAYALHDSTMLAFALIVTLPVCVWCWRRAAFEIDRAASAD